MKFFINGTRRGLGKHLLEKWGSVETLEECDVFINNKYDDWQQVDLLEKAAKLGKKIINISSNAADRNCVHPEWPMYSIHKMALDNLNDVMFYKGVDTTVIRPGYIDTERVSEIAAGKNKLSMKYVAEVIEWVLVQPHKIKEITVTPDDKLPEDKDNSAEQSRRAWNMFNLNMHANCQHVKKIGSYDLEKVRQEVKLLRLEHSDLEQISLQSETGYDFESGNGRIEHLTSNESSFDKLNIPDDWELAKIIKENNMYRTRILVLQPKQCYSYHYDKTPRTHFVVETNDWSFITIDEKLVHLPADGNLYYVDTTKQHTAMNTDLEKERIHIVGCVD